MVEPLHGELIANGVDLHLFRDASSGRDVVECGAAACATRPCANGAACAEHEGTGKWFCDCPPGFTGALCERPVCETNPCRGGGTCLSSNSGPGFLCLCPLGARGVLCEEGKIDYHSYLFMKIIENIQNRSFSSIYLHLNVLSVANISQPSFTPSVAGYSSFLTLPLEAARVSRSMDAQLKFTTTRTDQIALMVFMGQEGFRY